MAAFDSAKKLTVIITGNTTGLNKSFGTAIREAEGFNGKMKVVGNTLKSMAGPAMIGAAAAAGAFAVKLGVDGVKAAMDEDRQLALLKQTLDNVGQGFAMDQVNTFIDNLRFATGVTDDELRPAFEKLVGVTKDAASAQKLLSVAVDTSVGSGKDLQSVAAAMAKAVGGSTTALGRLVPGLDKTAIAGGGVDKVMQVLSARFGGSAASAANTLQGQLQRLSDGFKELQESFGHGFLDALGQGTPMVSGLAQTMRDLQPTAQKLGEDIGTIATSLASVAGSAKDADGGLSGIAGTIKTLADAWNSLPPWAQDFVQNQINPTRVLTESYKALSGQTATVIGYVRDYTDYNAYMADKLQASGKAQGILNGLIQDFNTVTPPAIDNVTKFAGGFESAATQADITAKRLGVLSDAITAFDAAVAQREAMQSFKDALKTYIADPTAANMQAMETAGSAMGKTFDDPIKGAQATSAAMDDIIGAATDAGQKVPSEVYKLKAAADGVAPSYQTLKSLMEQIPRDIETSIRMNVTVNGQYYDPYSAYNRHPATGGLMFASGGLIRGRGTHASDSIAAMLSRGEYVLNADTVKRLGVGTLNRINNGGGMGGGMVIQTLNVEAAPGERAEDSVPRALRRMAFVAGL